ncbi:hypothetical protein Glove_603g8 [Diversispora epigaea]|uniref:Uncharacterized protein n=1 Tax=Diversispora epigaea TaxID=1348612 RepID=A0A397G7E1_9GLOM|nr:hypothetical protein Glove_603g8 [Diversispora epigaea]
MKYREGTLIYDKKDKTFYVFDKKTSEKFDTFSSWITFLKVNKIFKGARSALATIFFEPNFSSSNLASIMRTEQNPYWKTHNLASIAEVISLIKTNITSKQEFFGVGMREIINGIGITFFGKENKVEKDLTIRWKKNLISYDMFVFEKRVKKINGIATGDAIERNLSEIEETIQFVSKSKICPGQITKGFEQVVKLRDNYLVKNERNSNSTIHETFATLENQGQFNEAYRKIDCDLLIMEMNICQNCQKIKNTLIQIQIRNQNHTNVSSIKTNHASREILTEKIQLQRKKIKDQNQILQTLQDKLQLKIENEKEEVSEDLGQIAEEISIKVAKHEVDISTFNPIFQELIRIQSGKAKGVKYHPIFLRWAISIYSRGGHAAYETIKSIMRLPSVSTLKSYINENQQHLGWQNKTAYHILQKMATENIGDQGRIGFFSHDSFKIQKV